MGIVLSAVILFLSGVLAIAFALVGETAAAIIATVVSVVATVIFFRALFGAPRALSRRSAYLLSWALLVAGLAGISLTLVVRGDRTDRLLVLGGAGTMLSAGLAGIRLRHGA